MGGALAACVAARRDNPREDSPTSHQDDAACGGVTRCLSRRSVRSRPARRACVGLTPQPVNSSQPRRSIARSG
eukprot:5083293-Prymnesium_polylepis.1